MRGARILLPIALALAAAACARQQPASYVFDPATGHYVPVVQQYSQPAYGQAYAQQTYSRQAYAQPAYAPQASPSSSRRGLFDSPQAAQQATAPPRTATQAYARATTQPRTATQAYARATTQPRAATQACAQAAAQPRYAPRTYAQPQVARGFTQSSILQPQPASGGTRGLFDFQGGTSVPGTSAYAAAQPAAPRGSVYQYRPPAAVAYAAKPAGYNYGYGYAPSHSEQPYTLGPGDKLRVTVFGQSGIGGSYLVDAGGNVSLPLVGTVSARGLTTAQLANAIADRLKQGYVREPHVTVSVASYRPFFILGEVTNPGQYPYVPNMTAESAIAIAGGFTPRAKKKEVELTRNARGQRFTGDVPLNYPLRPGDTVVVKERWF
jgi:polysaccharide export outer membrane protein